LEGEGEAIKVEEQGRRKRARIEIKEEQEQDLIEQAQEVSSLDIFPPEIWQHIFSYLDFDGVLAARAVNRDWNQLITG
ncbi:F-box protein, partial [Pseudomonas syringae pv. tagetis]|uniref:F-box protein n=1 Tax=Pseudomonas syringae group genomosp. 7 TaxID=251699 RepID=UPI00376FB687